MKIAIIHPSEIIRKGLVSLVKQAANCEILDFHEISELKSMLSQKPDFLIIFSDIKLFSENYFSSLQKKAKQIKTIGIVDNPDSAHASPPTDHTISLFSSHAEINTILSSCFETAEKRNDEHEGEELSVREKEVLKLVALGFSNKIIADKLFISIHTVISHRKNITEKLGIKSISGLTVYAILNNLLDTSEINPEDLI